MPLYNRMIAQVVSHCSVNLEGQGHSNWDQINWVWKHTKFLQIDGGIFSKQSQKLLLSLATMILNEGQNNWNWYQTILFSDVYHSNKCEKMGL